MKIKSHAILDVESRNKKARKIECLTSKFFNFDYGDFLEVGCGSGYITDYFYKKSNGQANVFAVDINDERKVLDHINFTKVENEYLPFNNEVFDFVISNHVIEHVGDWEVQVNHLSEIYRVMKNEGVFYVAVPNKWRLVEPHYSFPFLSWFSRSTSDKLLHLFKRERHYDCYPLTEQELEFLLNECGFGNIENATLDAIRVMYRIEGGIINKIFSLMPEIVLKCFIKFVPTLVFVCKK